MSIHVSALRGPVPQALVIALAVLGAPAVGYLLAGAAEHAPGLPPTPARLSQPGFSAAVSGLIALGVLAVLAPFIWRITRGGAASAAAAARGRFPLWGWLGVAILAGAWGLAWTPTAPEAVRQHVFTPLWLGYIITLQGWLQRRAGHCRLTGDTARFLALFPASAVFWWGFEYLNGFVGNWIYVGGEGLSPLGYTVAATLPFSTVLPAVITTRDLLATVPRLWAGLATAWRPPRSPGRGLAVAALLAGVGLLALLPVFPDWLFPAVWLAPLLVVTAVQSLAGDGHVLAATVRGDWSGAWLAAMAGLVCGFFWELWNWASLARWEYRIPFVEGLYLFEMPLLGYAGYLPFGLVCVSAAHLFTRRGLSADT